MVTRRFPLEPDVAAAIRLETGVGNPPIPLPVRDRDG